MIDKIKQIKKSRLNKNDIKLIDLFDKLQLFKYKKGICFIVYKGDIYFEIDTLNNILWCNYNLLINHYDIKFEKLQNMRNGFSILKEKCIESIFAFTPSSKLYYYLGKPKKTPSFLYIFNEIICILENIFVSLSKNKNN